jgi:glycosyltransferase involved in cell wall biosynthesis
MKIVMLCEFYNEELDYQEVMLAKYYRSLCHEVVVIAGATTSVHDYMSGRDGPHAQTIQEGRYARIYRMPIRMTLMKKIVVYQSVRKIIDIERPDLLYFHDIIPNMLEGLNYLRKNPEVCAIMDYHADFSNSGATRLSRLLLHRLSRRLVLARIRSRLSAILPIVPGSQRFLADLYGVPATETELFPLGVDMLEVAATHESGARTTIRRTLGIPDDALVIFTGGKLTPLKRTEEVLRAVALLDDPRIHVIVVGSVTGNPDYETLLREIPAKSVHFVGWQDRLGVYRHQAASDLAIFPASQSVLWQQSTGMGLPLVVSEGSGSGRARQDVGYMNRGNIHVLDPAQELAPQIAAFLSACHDDPGILSGMSAAAEAVTRTLLSYDRLARRTIEITNMHRQSHGAAPLAVDACAPADHCSATGSGGSKAALAT